MATQRGKPNVVAGYGGAHGAHNVLPMPSKPAIGGTTDDSRLLNVAESISNMGHWHVQILTGVVTWSDAMYDIFGVDSATFIPSMDTTLVYCHPDDRDHVSQVMGDAGKNGKDFEIDFRITRPDGEHRTLICKGQPEFDDDGHMVAMFGVTTDVTEAFEAIRSIQDQKEMLGLAAQLAHLGHWVWNRDENRLSYCSDELARIYDVTPIQFAELFSLPDAMAKSVVIGSRRRYQALVTKALVSGEAYDVEYRIETRAGVLKDIHEIGQPIFDENGRLARFIATVQDVTEAKQRENDLNDAKCVLQAVATALKISEGKLRDVIEGSIQGIVVLHDFRPVFVNQAYADILGAKSRDDILSAGDIRGNIVAGGVECATKFWDEVMKGPPDAKSQRLAVLPTFDGRTVWADTIGRRIEWDGEPAFLMMVLDVTERHLAEEELKNKTLELQELNQQKDKLFSIIAHDLKSPFNSIIGFSDLLAQKAKELPPEKVADYAEVVRESAAGVHDLLDNLLAWASIQMRGAELHVTPLKMAEVFDAGVAPLLHMAGDKGVAIDNQIGDLIAMGDQSLVPIVLRNLVSNGIKFSHKGGVVRIRADVVSEGSSPMVRVSVHDEGVGMGDIALNDPFALSGTASGVGTSGERGTGLGLYLCRDIVKRHGGSISIESSPGCGTSVHFTLRCADVNQDSLA